MHLSQRGFALLDIIMATTLVSGIILIIMLSFTHIAKVNQAHAIGKQLAPIFSDLIVSSPSSDDDGYTLILDSDGDVCESNTSDGILESVGLDYVDALNTAGLNLCDALVAIS